jgi:hypothetical protein
LNTIPCLLDSGMASSVRVRRRIIEPEGGAGVAPGTRGTEDEATPLAEQIAVWHSHAFAPLRSARSRSYAYKCKSMRWFRVSRRFINQTGAAQPNGSGRAEREGGPGGVYRSSLSSPLARSKPSEPGPGISDGNCGAGNSRSMTCMMTRLSVRISPSSSIAGSNPDGILSRNHCGLSPYDLHAPARVEE